MNKLFIYLGDVRVREGDDYGYNVYSQLELKEFGDVVVNISFLYNCFNNVCKVVICENNIRCFFSDVSFSDILLKKIL